MHTSSSAYQHSPSDQVGASDDATFERLSIYDATRRVWILDGLGDLTELEARQLCIYVKRANMFSAGAEVLPLNPMGQGDLPVLG